jgi:hypothetical protein
LRLSLSVDGGIAKIQFSCLRGTIVTKGDWRTLAGGSLFARFDL